MVVGRAHARPRLARTPRYFDIDWDLDPGGRIVLPVLGSDDDVADLEVDGEVLRLGDLAYPIAPGTGRGRAPRCTTASTTG